MYNFTGFGEKANMVLNNALEVAEDSGHTYIGSEHILLGILQVADSVAGKLLNSKNITYNKILTDLKFLQIKERRLRYILDNLSEKNVIFNDKL